MWLAVVCTKECMEWFRHIVNHHASLLWKHLFNETFLGNSLASLNL